MAKEAMQITPEILQQAQQGDANAISIIYRTYLERIYRYVAYRIQLDADIEDVTMDIFVQMMRYLPGYRYTGVPFEAWLYRIASTQVAGYYRKRNQGPQQVDLPDTLYETKDLPEQHVIKQEERSHLRNTLYQLASDEQEVLILRFVERKTHQDVATILNKSVSAVKSIQHRALYHLSRLLGCSGKVRHYLRGNYDQSQ